jgi:hypothetical protein
MPAAAAAAAAAAACICCSGLAILQPPIPNSWSDVTVINETETISTTDAATSQYVFIVGSCANILKTATLGGTASVQCFTATGALNWAMTAKWIVFTIQSIILPGDAPACDLLTDSVAADAERRTTCPFFMHYVFHGDLAAEIGAGSCVFTSSLYCVKPGTAPAAGRSLFIGTGRAFSKHQNLM